jgi:hypothetical protein
MEKLKKPNGRDSKRVRDQRVDPLERLSALATTGPNAKSGLRLNLEMRASCGGVLHTPDTEERRALGLSLARLG